MDADKKNSLFARRIFLGSSLLLPFLGMAKTPVLNEIDSPKNNPDEDDDEFTTMLTAKGGVVRVKKSTLKNAKVVKQNMSNKSLLHWLKLKDKA
ncbi:MAG: hypothetical protein RIC06_07515 [Cyclobacteriaceae bacterium]